MFKVPNKFRVKDGYLGSENDAGLCGAFEIKHSDGYMLFCIADDGRQEIESKWEHVSCSKSYGTRVTIPSWNDMCIIKNLFWDEEDCVVQYHPAKKDYINLNPYVLHLWRPCDLEFPKPPKILVGI